MSIDTIELWHRRARSKPTAQDFQVQLGCHLEEVAEMLADLKFCFMDDSAATTHEGKDVALYFGLVAMADMLKSGEVSVMLPPARRANFAKELADQVVTAVGVGYCAGMEMEEAVKRVNRSNWSKFGDNGQPVRGENGKITKGHNYAPPDLTGCY